MAEGCSGSCGSCSSCGSCGGEDKMAKKMGLISRKILVLSGKGGVGKSSVAATLALQLAASGRKVGLLDCDFHGPSLPTILGVTHKKLDYSEENGIMPLPMGNLRFLSVGLLMDDPDQAIVWRGPAKMGVIKQLLEDTCWENWMILCWTFPREQVTRYFPHVSLFRERKTPLSSPLRRKFPDRKSTRLNSSH